MKYRLRSIFSSLQGEGRNTGRPATFIRFAGCNLNCPWCDTRKHTKEMLALHEIVAKVKRLDNRMVVVTGGEPTIVIGLREILEAGLADYSLAPWRVTLLPWKVKRAIGEASPTLRYLRSLN